MNFSETWKSMWPVGAVFPAPNILYGPSAEPLGTLLFGPSPSSPPRTLLSSPSLARRVPLPLRPSSIRDGLRTFFRDPEDGFVPSSVQAVLVDAVLPEPGVGTEDHDFPNQLHVLRCGDGNAFILFFPTGENLDEVGYIRLSVKGAGPEIRPEDVDVFRQKEGFAHPRHRITGMSVIPADPPDANWDDVAIDPLAEGYLLATTLYAVNWFKVETRTPVSGLAQERPFLVPIGRRSFASQVVHACWNPHFQEESVVLLENGEMYWMKLGLKRGVRIRAPEVDSGRWLSCEFGGQPWILFVASSIAVMTVDLRSKQGSRRTVLAHIEEPSSYMIVHSMEDAFVAFCRAGFDDFHFSVVTEHHLLLFDTRQPLVPVLKWDHGLNRPRHVAMYRLWELRPSKEFKWASESGFAILVGSFCNSEFSLFCCGPKMQGDSCNPMLYAWELPSDICLSGWQGNLIDEILKQDFSRDVSFGGTEWRLRETVVGIFILPEVTFSMLSRSEDTGGFILLRILSSGKLEWQQYCASCKPFVREQGCKLGASSRSQDSPLLFWDQEERSDTRHDYLKLKFLSAHLSGSLLKTLTSEMHNSGLNDMESNQSHDKHKVLEHVEKELQKTSPTVSDCLNQVSIPMSINEIASQRALSSLPSDIFHLAFSKHSELFTRPQGFSFELPEVHSSLACKKLPSLFLRKPTGRSEKWTHKVLPTDCLVGPVLPLPVLLILRQIEENYHALCLDEASNGNDLLSCEYKMILDGVFPGISIAEDNTCNEYFSSQELQHEQPFFIHEPKACASGNPIYHKTSSAVVQQKESHKLDHSLTSETTIKDDKFSIFISGFYDKPDYKSSIQDMATSEIFDDLAPMRLDIDSSVIKFSQNEHKIFSCLKRQFSKWQNLEVLQDFHVSPKIPKTAP